MDAQIREEWATALESGRFPQGNSALKQDGRYCCLGVLCEILKKRLNLVVSESPSYTKPGTEVVSYDGDFFMLPEKVRLYAGVRIQDQELLVEANDVLRQNFPQIAELIRTNL